MNFTVGANNVISKAVDKAEKEKHQFVTPEHLLYGILESEEFFVRKLNSTPSMKKDLETYFREKVPVLKKNDGFKTSQSVDFLKVIQACIEHVDSSQKNVIDSGDILASIYEVSEQSKYILQQNGNKKRDILVAISQFQRNESVEETSEQPSAGDFFGAPAPKKNLLKDFSVELVGEAKIGKIDPVIGRSAEIERTIQILCRKKKNNPIHVGEAGVGKTSITEGLAQRIAEGTVPDILKGFEIYSVDMGSLLAGTRFRGDFEERITQIIKEIQSKEKAIMFIDEIHTIIGAGSSGHSGTTDAANILKPALASGRLRVIGATTYDEYKKNFEKDAALARRFQKVDILEPSEEDTYKILVGLKESYEKFHNVKYSDDSLKSIARLSHLYINDRFLPDKAIDVMDEVGSMFRIKNYGTENKDHDVDEHDIEEVVSKIAKIPENTVSSNEIEKLAKLSDDLKAQVFGQDEAINQIVQAIKRSRAGFRKKDKPVANLLFAGRTGVGKTHIVRKLSEIMGIPLIRFDMSEYQEKHSVSKFVGAPAGYTGYEEGGLLVDAIRKEPHSILLLDEIEKAHPDVFNVLLQVMDYATLTDNQGRKADFRNVIIVMTSNAGAHEIDSHPVGFGNTTVGREAVNNAVEKTFTPEFRNRLDKVITFNDLTSDVVKKVVLAEIKDFETLLTEKNIKLSITDKATDWFVKNGYSIEYGARPIARLIDEKIKDIFVDAVLFGSLSKGGKATIDIENDDVKVTI